MSLEVSSVLSTLQCSATTDAGSQRLLLASAPRELQPANSYQGPRIMFAFIHHYIWLMLLIYGACAKFWERTIGSSGIIVSVYRYIWNMCPWVRIKPLKLLTVLSVMERNAVWVVSKATIFIWLNKQHSHSDGIQNVSRVLITL